MQQLDPIKTIISNRTTLLRFVRLTHVHRFQSNALQRRRHVSPEASSIIDKIALNLNRLSINILKLMMAEVINKKTKLPAQSPSNPLQRFRVVVASYEIRIPNSLTVTMLALGKMTFVYLKRYCCSKDQRSSSDSYKLNLSLSRLSLKMSF